MDTSKDCYITLNNEQAAKFYQDNSTFFDEAKENQYFIIEDKDLYCYQKNNFRKINFPKISSGWAGEIKPLDIYQRAAIDMLGDRESKVKLIRGVYGSGKDFIMINKALSLIEEGEFEKIIFIRPNVTLANVPQIGYLPNGVDEKLGWTMAPLFDKVGGNEGLNRLIDKNIIEMVPLLFIRGMSFNNSIIYVTEAQNIDSEIAKVLLGRIGEGSELWLNGDNHQCDSRVFDKDNGLTKMVDRLFGNELFSYVYLPNTHRSKVANLANLLDD